MIADVASIERAADHVHKWLGLIVAVLTLITLYQSYRLHRIELAEKLEAQK